MFCAKNQENFCRVCLNEIQNLGTSKCITMHPKHDIKLDENFTAISYLQCYYFCLGRDFKNIKSLDTLRDYDYICVKCMELLMKVTKFIVNSKTNEDFLLSMFGSDEKITESSLDVEEEDHANEVDGFMTEEYLEATDTEECSVMEEEYLSDAFMENCNEKSKKEDPNITQINNHNVDAFEEVILEVATNNGEVEQTILESGDCSIPLEQFEVFNCELCTNVFSYERQLYEHYNKEHDQKTFPIQCETCKDCFVSLKALRYHRDTIHKYIDYLDCEICGKAIVTKFYESHRDLHVAKCNECGHKFKTQHALDQHLRLDHEIQRLKRYDCQECDRYFYSSENLQLHIMMHNNNLLTKDDTNKYSCYICSKSFARPIFLKQHLQKHRGATMQCPHCSKKFTRLKEIEQHIRLHIKNFPHKCNICQQRFSLDEHLSSHMERHKTERYPCPICNKIFTSPFSLKQHTYEHSGWPLTCNMCDKGFASVYIMRRHLKTSHREIFRNHYTDDLADAHYKRHKIKEILPKMINGKYLI